MGVERSSAKIVSNTVASFSQVIVGSMSSVGSHRNRQGSWAAAGRIPAANNTTAMTSDLIVITRANLLRWPFLGQCDIEGRALSEFAFRPHAAAVARNDSLHVREPDARALELFRAMQPLKHAEEAVRVRHVKTDAVVFYVYDELAAGLVAASDFDDGMFARARIFQRIREQVREHELQHAGIPGHRRQRLNYPLDRSPRIRLYDIPLRLTDDRVEIDARLHHLRPAHPGEDEQRVDELAHFYRTVRDETQIAQPFVVELGTRRFLKQLGEAADVAERRTEVM